MRTSMFHYNRILQMRILLQLQREVMQIHDATRYLRRRLLMLMFSERSQRTLRGTVVYTWLPDKVLHSTFVY